MSVSVAHRGRPRGALFVAGAIAVASAIGVLAVVSPVLAVAATVGGVAVPAAVLRPKLVVHLLVVSIYVGYVSEAVAREHRDRQEAEDRLTKELRGMSRFQTLASSVMAEAFSLSLRPTAARAHS